jgi:hypothetical protein
VEHDRLLAVPAGALERARPGGARDRPRRHRGGAQRAAPLAHGQATGRVGSSQVFGTLRFRQVATIPIRTPQDLAQTPYSEHTIVRRNTWVWNKGRQVYELHAPGRATYVMQAWSQIRDPSEGLADLSPLGARLMLPAGWSYTVRKLRRDLVLAAHGSATVVQDELLNTYQREP